MRIIFAGNSHLAATHLRALSLNHEVIAVYTQPDRPAGRGKRITASPVKLLAEELGLQIYQPVSLKDFEQQSIVISLQADIMVVVAYGLMMPQAVLQAPRRDSKSSVSTTICRPQRSKLRMAQGAGCMRSRRSSEPKRGYGRSVTSRRASRSYTHQKT